MSIYIIAYLSVAVSLIFIFSFIIGVIDSSEIEFPNSYEKIFDNQLFRIKIILLSALIWPILSIAVLLFGYIYLMVFLTKKLIKFFTCNKKENNK